MANKLINFAKQLDKTIKNYEKKRMAKFSK